MVSASNDDDHRVLSRRGLLRVGALLAVAVPLAACTSTPLGRVKYQPPAARAATSTMLTPMRIQRRALPSSFTSVVRSMRNELSS